MTILSLFDGISCGRVALDRAGIKVTEYFASEIDKHSIKVSKDNHPDIQQLGDVRDVSPLALPKIDILIGGSPCQSFSFAGSRKGMTSLEDYEVTTLEDYLRLKDDNVTFKGQSYLFWEFVRILKESSPTFFLLENVRMSKKWEKVISNALGVEPILIDSALVSAQNRSRLYWSNIPIVAPSDSGAIFSDILTPEHGQPVRNALDNPRVGGITRNGNGVRPHRGDGRKTGISELGRLYRPDSPKVGSVIKSHTVKVLVKDAPGALLYRQLAPIEAERLQTLPDGYTSGIPDRKRYECIGNGWTVDVIARILENIHAANLL